jgi:hypothetical protein
VKTKTLLERISDLLSSSKRKKKARLRGLTSVLAKLEKRVTKLEKKLAGTKNKEDRKRLRGKLAVVRAQIKKGRALRDKL